MSSRVKFDRKLLQAIRAKRNDEAKLLITEELAKTSDAFGTLLLYSSESNNDFIVHYLLELGSVVDAVSSNNKTPLFIAVLKGHSEVVKILLKAGANIHRACASGKSALEVAFDPRYIRRSVLQCIIPKVRSASLSIDVFVDRLVRAGCTLHGAVMSGDIDLLTNMLNRGNANINVTFCGGSTALMVATEENDIDIVRILVERGADVNITDNNANNALFAAARFGNPAIIEVLLERRAEAKQENVAGYTPLSLLLSMPRRIDDVGQSVRCAELLLQSGASLSTSKFTISDHFDYVAVPQKEALARTLVAHLMLQDVSPSNDRIARYVEYKKLCQQTLKINVFKDMPLAKLLMRQCDHKMRSYARNENFKMIIQNFSLRHKLAETHSYYDSLLTKRVSQLVRIVEHEDTAIFVMCKIFDSNYSRSFIASRMVLAYLKQRDLEQLCRV